MSLIVLAVVFVAGVLVGFAIDNMAYRKMLEDERKGK